MVFAKTVVFSWSCFKGMIDKSRRGHQSRTNVGLHRNLSLISKVKIRLVSSHWLELYIVKNISGKTLLYGEKECVCIDWYTHTHTHTHIYKICFHNQNEMSSDKFHLFPSFILLPVFGLHVFSLHPYSRLNYLLKLTQFWFLSLIIKQVLFFFNWRILVLQCCVGFCHTIWQISYLPYIYISSSS